MARRYYSSIAARTALAAGVDGTTTTFFVDAVNGWPSQFPYTLIIDEDTINEEIVEVTGRSSTTLSVTRGVDGTSGTAHSAGATVRHGVSARDFDEPNALINGTGTVTETMLASGAVTEAKLGTGAVTSAKILDGTIVDVDVNASAAIAQSKIANLTSDLASKADYPSGGSNGDMLTKSGTTTAWAAPSVAGLTLITSDSFSAVSSVSINNCFNSTYQHYRIAIKISSATGSGANLSMRLRASGSDTNTNYEQNRIQAYSGTTASYNDPLGAGEWFLANIHGAASTNYLAVIDINSPNVAAPTSSVHHAFSAGSAEAKVQTLCGGRQTSSTQFDGFTLLTNGTNMTGNVRVYGYKD